MFVKWIIICGRRCWLDTCGEVEECQTQAGESQLEIIRISSFSNEPPRQITQGQYTDSIDVLGAVIHLWFSILNLRKSAEFVLPSGN